MARKIKIANKFVGTGYPVFIIAEAGVNHNGSLNSAKKIVDAAKEAGADAVKFQTFKAEDVTTKTAELAEYQKKNIEKNETQLEMIKKLELSYEDFRKLKNYCDKKQIIFLSTPHSEDAANFLESLVVAYKIGSGDLTNLPLLEGVAQKKKPMILSTGMSGLREIREAVKLIKKNGNKEIVLLHCTTNYPCPINEVNLKAMATLKKEFDLPVGYSDHTKGFLAPVMAAALGAQIIEKHFTLDKKLPGPDHKASQEPKGFKKMVCMVREAEKIMGSATKKPTEGEKKIMKIVRKSIVAKIEIKAGQIIKKEMLDLKRPGTGIEPKHINRIIGRKAKINIKEDQLINWKDL